jgi:hypothetical protein
MDEGFTARMKFAESSEVDLACRKIMEERVPNCSIRRGTLEEDISGIDYQITAPNGKAISVEFKIRSKDHGRDLCLEYISSIEDFRIGWTVDPSKVTDFVVWYWTDTRRWVAYDYKHLRAAAKAHAFAWLSKGFKQIENSTEKVKSRNYHSRAAFVPESTVDTMIEATEGSLRKWEGVVEQVTDGGTK